MEAEIFRRLSFISYGLRLLWTMSRRAERAALSLCGRV